MGFQGRMMGRVLVCKAMIPKNAEMGNGDGGAPRIKADGEV